MAEPDVDFRKGIFFITYNKNMTKILHCSLLLYNQIPVLKVYSSIPVGVRALPGVRIDCMFTPILVVYILIGITCGC